MWRWPIFSFILIFLFAAPFFPAFPSDSEHYRAIAQGLMAEVPKPFSSRVLLPFAARGLSELLSLQLESSFSIIAIAIYVAFFVLLISIARRLHIDGRAVAIGWLLPGMVFAATAVYLPDLAAMFWTILILWAICVDRPWLAAFLLFPAAMTRESLALLGAVLVLLLLLRRKVVVSAATMAFVVFGLWLSARLSSESLSNVHQMNALLYMILKVPVNFVSNLIGVGFQTTAFRSCDVAAIVVHAPGIGGLGNIKEIGICPLDVAALMGGWLPYFSAFGIGAGVLLALTSKIRDSWREMPMAVQLALAYGAVMFVIGPMSGKSVMRLTMYAWPAFLIGVPYILSSRMLPAGRRVYIWLAGMQIVCAWAAAPFAFPSLFDYFPWLLETTNFLALEVFALGVGLATNLAAFLICRQVIGDSQSAIVTEAA